MASVLCRWQEVEISDPATQRSIYRLLLYRKKGRGRCLRKAFRDLPQGARLEPSAELPDVSLFETKPTPFRCLFYIAGPHARVLHKSPLLEIPGLSLDSWCIDILHTWHYGPMSTYLAYTMRQLLASPIFQPGIAAFLDKEECEKMCLMALKAELWMHCKRRRETDPEWSKKGSEVGVLRSFCKR